MIDTKKIRRVFVGIAPASHYTGCEYAHPGCAIAALAAEVERLRSDAQAARDILADMHAEDDTCQFRGGDGCLACMAQESLRGEQSKRFGGMEREIQRLRNEVERLRTNRKALQQEVLRSDTQYYGAIDRANQAEARAERLEAAIKDVLYGTPLDDVGNRDDDAFDMWARSEVERRWRDRLQQALADKSEGREG
jgi:hypothetical protein